MALSMVSLKQDPSFGLDSRRSWVPAVFLSVSLTTVLIGQYSVGVHFYGIVRTYGVSQKDSSWPLVLSQSLSFLAGMSVGGVFVAATVLVSQYFEARRATAIGLIVTLSGTSLLYVPYMADVCHSTYGINGPFLLLGGVMLNAFPPVFTLRSPEWLRRETTPSIRARNEFHEATLAEKSNNHATIDSDHQNLSSNVVAFGMATFIMLAVDLATDREVKPSKAVFLLNVFAAADICMKPTSGLLVDFKILSLEAVMFLGFLQFIACELLAILKALPLMLASGAIYGVSNGCKFTLLAPCLVKNFEVEALPIMMGVVTFCNGLALLTRPLLVVKTYNDLLHFKAGINAFFGVAWIVQIYMKRREQPALHT
ncbi:uncharacterized protein LOC125756426 [Rhipicephalus sanguineus]|uniref:uncharacterized protein LOC125756426 n=1 Tax=Rhipicephalus sanguineus TaxID=34632 RepID=UPI0020C57AD7|nr:uncharacterized protein LOC125756426 [Rhipicephalus sanguineus]